MQNSINERVKILIDSLANGVPARFAKSLGVAASVVANYLPGSSRKGSPSFDVLQLIAKTYPQINIDWVVTGEGDMLKETGEPATPPGYLHQNVGNSRNKINVGNVPVNPESSEIDYYRQRIRELENKYDTLLEKYERLLTKKE